jgi:hypothetical protein
MYDYDHEKLHSQSNQILKVVVGMVFIALMIAIFAWTQREQESPFYPPPERIEITVSGRIINEYGEPELAQHVVINIDLDDVEQGSIYEHESTVGGNSRFEGSLDSVGASTGCVRGFIEIDHHPQYDFEFGIEHVEFGAGIEFTFIAGYDIITYDAVITPSEIKPDAAPEPVIKRRCLVE